MIKYVNTSPSVTQRVYRLPWKRCMPWFMLECDFGHTSVISHSVTAAGYVVSTVDITEAITVRDISRNSHTKWFTSWESERENESPTGRIYTSKSKRKCLRVGVLFLLGFVAKLLLTRDIWNVWICGVQVFSILNFYTSPRMWCFCHWHGATSANH